MAYEIGTATDYKDLIAKLKTFVTTNAALVAAGQQWTVMRHTAPASGDHELILRGPGLAGADQIYVGIRTEEVSASSVYNWRMYGLTGYATQPNIFGQPGIIADTTQCPRLLLTNSGMSYWFFANGRRIIVVARAGTTYQIAYLGLILPYGPPANLPYPLFIGGCGCSSVPWTDTSALSTPFFKAALTGIPGTTFYTSGQALIGAWRSVLHQYGGTTYTTDFIVWPYGMPENAGTNFLSLNTLKRCPDGTAPILPVLLCSATPDKNVYGEFDGMGAVPGVGFVPEDTITVGSDQYIVFSGGRLTSAASFIAVKVG